jgi:hypothetical protein
MPYATEIHRTGGLFHDARPFVAVQRTGYPTEL